VIATEGEAAAAVVLAGAGAAGVAEVDAAGAVPGEGDAAVTRTCGSL